MSESIEIARQELYDALWSMPVALAAVRFRITSKRMKMLSRELDVPVPSLGHWRKSPERRERDRVPLPPAKLGKDRIWVTRSARHLVHRPPVDVQPLPSDVHRQHECTRRTAEALEKTRPDKRGKLAVIGAGIASVAVHPPQVPRAIAILNALLEAAEDAGLSITTKSIPTALVVAGVQVPFSLTADQRGLLLILGEEIGEGQRLWRDKAAEPLDEQVTDIVAAARLHAQAIEAHERRIADRNASRRAEELDRLQFSKRLTFVTEHADRLVEADKVQRLADHLRATDDGSSRRLPESCAGLMTTWCG
jgi:hypothetical protein